MQSSQHYTINLIKQIENLNIKFFSNETKQVVFNGNKNWDCIRLTSTETVPSSTEISTECSTR